MTEKTVSRFVVYYSDNNDNQHLIVDLTEEEHLCLYGGDKKSLFECKIRTGGYNESTVVKLASECLAPAVLDEIGAAFKHFASILRKREQEQFQEEVKSEVDSIDLGSQGHRTPFCVLYDEKLVAELDEYNANEWKKTEAAALKTRTEKVSLLTAKLGRSPTEHEIRHAFVVDGELRVNPVKIRRNATYNVESKVSV